MGTYTDLPKEPERKFLVASDAWKNYKASDVLQIEQGYFPQDKENGTRIYIKLLPKDPLNCAKITVISDDHTLSFYASNNEINKDFLKVTQLEAYNKDTGELTSTGDVEARIRTQTSQIEPDKAIFCIKKYTEQIELETEIKLSDAFNAIQKFIPATVKKRRTVIPDDDQDIKYEVDEYLDENAGFTTVDIEVLYMEKFDEIQKPSFVGPDITDVKELKNSAIAKNGVPNHWKNTRNFTTLLTL